MNEQTNTQGQQNLSFKIEQLDLFVFRAPAEPPVQTSFGIMRDRPAVLVRVRDADGAFGWGEIWCNFPAVGAEHRARMAAHYLPSLVLGQSWASPSACFETLTERLAVLAIQSGESGPIQQMIAGLDTAIWDLLARKRDEPLWKVLAGDTGFQPAPVAVYASGLNPTEPERLAAGKMAEGYRAFKLKVGFGADRDVGNLRALRDVIGGTLPLFADANQAWGYDDAVDAAHRMARFELGWLEEPMRADVPRERWAQLAQAQPIPLAGGENLAGMRQFAPYLFGPGLAVIQPDLGKWGGLSGCLAVGRAAVTAGKMFCPHWLGGGIGQMASLHLKAAVGGEGYVEVDANPNPLRELLAMPTFFLTQGRVELGGAGGLGVVPDLSASKDFIVSVVGVPAAGV